MKVSLNWLKEYIDIPLDPAKVSEILTDIGLEVEGEEEVEAIKGGLKGVVVGLVKECGKHPTSNKPLSVTKVDIGAEEDIPVVCGAPNVAAGQKVLVATVGTTLYTAEGEAWKIKKGKLAGEPSHGMICAEDELGLGNDHDGIMVLPEDVAVGTLAKDYFKLETDTVFDIGLTPNRSDATAHLGVAKDLAAALKINYDNAGLVNAPDINGFKIDNTNLPIDVVVENTEACPRYTGVTISGVTVKESPDWLKTRLEAIGVRPINNIVDITNFVLHELGQPLHAFDADQIKGNKIIVKTLPEGSPFLSLDEVERKLHAEDLMICDGESNGMCIGGVFGGINSGVKPTTKNIFLESAHFNARWIRRTSTRHLLRTDAAVCFEKGSDPNISVYALKRAAMLIKELAGGEISSELVDLYPNKVKKNEVAVSYKNINRLIGVEIPPVEVKAIFAALEIDIVKEDKDGMTVAIPTNKVDVTREVDVIEEILRIYGFNKVPIPTQIKSTISIGEKPDKNKVKNNIADYLASNGYDEMMAVSLTKSKYFKEILPVEEDSLVYVNNTSNIELDVMRPTMLFSGLEAVVHNQNRQNPDLKLFEFGHSYTKNENGYKENAHLSIILTGKKETQNWHNSKLTDVSYYTLKAQVGNILAKLGVSNFQQSFVKDEIFASGLKYHRGPQILVKFGKVQPAILRKMDVKQAVYFADFNWNALIKTLRKHKIDYVALTKYPSIRRDLALVIDNSIKFDDIAGIARKTGKKILKDINLFDVYENEKQLGKDKKSYAVSFIFEDPTKTLKDKEVDKIMNQLINNYEGKLGATIRR